MKHKKWPVQLEWEGSKESFEQVIETLTTELNEHGLKHFDMFEELSVEEPTTSVGSFVDSMTPQPTKTSRKTSQDEVQE